jgi:putative hydrolase of the HAD superfamily
MSELILVFDLDDTLYPERQFALSGFAAAGRWAEAELGVAGLAADMARLLDGGHLGELFRLALAARLPNYTPEQLACLIEAYRNHDPQLSLFDDAAWALAHFAPQAKLGLITDGTLSMQAKKVAALGIGARFGQIIYTHALGGRQYAKPHPRSYELVEAALAGKGDRLVYIGDNPAKDFIVPNERGWISIMVERPEFGRIHAHAKIAPGGRPQHTVASLTALPAVLGKAR